MWIPWIITVEKNQENQKSCLTDFYVFSSKKKAQDEMKRIFERYQDRYSYVASDRDGILQVNLDNDTIFIEAMEYEPNQHHIYI